MDYRAKKKFFWNLKFQKRKFWNEKIPSSSLHHGKNDTWGIVVQNGTGWLRSAFRKPRRPWQRISALAGARGLLFVKRLYASLNRFVLLVSVGSFFRESSNPVSEKAFKV